MTIIDWRSICDSSKMRQRLQRCRIMSNVINERKMFDETVPDSLFYISSMMNSHILSRVAEQANHAFKQLALKDSLFFGKVSIVAHSLGTVISYDILVKQNPNNFKGPHCELEASNRARQSKYKVDEIPYASERSSSEGSPKVSVITSGISPDGPKKSKVFDEKMNHCEYDQSL